MRALLRGLAVLPLLAFSTAMAAPAGGVDGRWDLHLDRDAPGLLRDVRGTLDLKKGDGGWSGSLTFEVLMNGQRQDLAQVEVRGRKVSFVVAALDYRFDGGIEGDGLEGVCVSKAGQRWKWTAARAKPAAPIDLFEKGLAGKGFLPRALPKSVGLDEKALWKLVREAEASDTDALIVVKDGKVVCERTFGRKEGRFHVMSVTKFVTAFAVGLLLEEGAIDSLDAPVSRWFPEWAEGNRGKITLRHLVTHTSGIAHGETARALNEAKDKVAYVLGLEPGEPGSAWSYNNEAVALLSGILAKASGMPCDAYLQKRLFDPLGIVDAAWDRDGAGRTVTYAQLGLTARELALVGELVAERGTRGGRRVVAEKTLDLLAGQATPLSPVQGVLWFRVLEGETCVGVRHDGWLGQHLVVYPAEKLVGVRLRRGVKGEDAKFGYPGFPASLRECLGGD